jgi:hypothetical protein
LCSGVTAVSVMAFVDAVASAAQVRPSVDFSTR